MSHIKNMKDISLRPKKQLMSLFEAVQNLDNLPSTNRNSIIDRALTVSLKSNYVNWQAVSEVLVENNFNSPIPNHIVLKVDEDKFLQVKAQIKEAFSVEKITIPYTLRLLLTLYFIHLKQQTDAANEKDSMSELLQPDVKIDTVTLKNEYEQSFYSGKKRLLEMCRVFLKNNPNINERLVEQCAQGLKMCSDFIDLSKYFSGISESNPTSTYTAKVLAGLFILRIESVFEPNESKGMLDQVIKKLEVEFQTIGHVIDNTDSGDYYKNVYAKMMGGRA